ncbi:exonuclease SbcD [Pararhodobacter marinus]|uniref:Exonuclease SbcD n=1 Tax=Pararhodobacter marinus TaxID=2184063 RepID=A0A2U2CB15_9RHOB|nr:metallophosphoesterase [Pararhodobacter marinus]PWE29052.1 exonuclease SbcD [Pararhodobacter marinus]
MADAFTFLHSADLHLGRRFGNLPEALRGRLIEARHQIIARLAQAARDHGARDILLAGDTFDTETPAEATLRQALHAMADDASLTWWLLPGNHDSLGAEALWEDLARQAPGNLRLLTREAPERIAPGVTLLPAPLPRRHAGRDLTQWMTGAATPEGDLRLGLAHGGIQSFSEDTRDEGIIPPDRAQSAGLAYLALGDWHGQKQVGPRTAYSGTPEFEEFRHTGRGACLAVTLRGEAPVVKTVETGTFHWAEAELDLVPGQDAPGVLDALLPPPGAARRDHLLRIHARGRATLEAQQALRAAARQAEPDFAHFRLETAMLDTEITEADLDQLDHGGALRAAADRLAAQAGDPALAESERRIASGALNRLYSYLADDA